MGKNICKDAAADTVAGQRFPQIANVMVNRLLKLP